MKNKINKITNTDIFLIDVERLNQIKIAGDVCNIIHQQIHILGDLQNGQNQREYITDLYQAVLDVARSFNDERIEIYRGKNDE